MSRKPPQPVPELGLTWSCSLTTLIVRLTSRSSLLSRATCPDASEKAPRHQMLRYAYMARVLGENGRASESLVSRFGGITTRIWRVLQHASRQV